MSNDPLYYSKLPKSQGAASNGQDSGLRHTVNPLKFVSLSAHGAAPIPSQKLHVEPNLFLKIGKTNPINKKSQGNAHKNYRTRMCPYGRDCRKRFTCTFAHTENELRKPFIKRKNPCILYQRGQCSLGSACRDYHGNIDLQKKYQYKEKSCEEYARTGSCSKGLVCIFLHEKPEQSVEPGQLIQSEEPIEAVIQQFAGDQGLESQVLMQKIEPKDQSAKENAEQPHQEHKEGEEDELEQMLFIPL